MVDSENVPRKFRYRSSRCHWSLFRPLHELPGPQVQSTLTARQLPRYSGERQEEAFNASEQVYLDSTKIVNVHGFNIIRQYAPVHLSL